MEKILSITERSMNYLSSIKVSDIIDIIIVAYLIYQIIMLIRKTNSANLAKGIGIFILALGLSYILKLTMINYILRKAVELGLIAVVVLFQPELRRLLERVGTRLFVKKQDDSYSLESALKQVVMACSDMSESRTGALIIFERNYKMHDIIATGTVIDSEVNSELIKNIFYDKAPLHDGALIIREGRIAAAGCVLPLTKSRSISKELGMRHRAGIGLSEVTDALVIIVSEETGSISVAIEGMLKRHLSPQTLDQILRNELLNSSVQQTNSTLSIIKGLFKVDKNGETGNEKK